MGTIKPNVLRAELKLASTKEFNFKGAVNRELSFYLYDASYNLLKIVPWKNRGLGVIRKLINSSKGTDVDSIILSNHYMDWRITIYTKA